MFKIVFCYNDYRKGGSAAMHFRLSCYMYLTKVKRKCDKTKKYGFR